MKSYTIPLTLVQGYQPEMNLLAASDNPQLKTSKETILIEYYVL